MKKIAVVGAGTIIYQDEGIGVYASKYLEENYEFDGDVTIVDGGVLGFQLMKYYQEYDKVIILDTITMDDEVGSLYNIPSQELLGLGSYKQTAHEVEIIEMLEICSLLEKMADVNIVGIVPEDIESVNIDLTKSMKKQFPQMIQIAIVELEKDVNVMKKDTYITLDQVIHGYANPSLRQEAS